MTHAIRTRLMTLRTVSWPLKARLALLCYGLGAVVYALLIALYAAFGPIDDHLFLDTLLAGKRFPWLIAPGIGRFFPLDGQEYNLLALFSVSPGWFYTFNAVQFVLFAGVFAVLALRTGASVWFVALCGTLLLLTPAFTTAWFRLLIPERNVIFYTVIFLYGYVRGRRAGWRGCVPGLLAANLALYYKEPAFLLIGSLAAVHLGLSWSTATRREKMFDGLVLVSCGIYIAIYYFLIYLHRSGTSYATSHQEPLAIVLRSFALSDPILVFGLWPATLWRAWRIIIARHRAYPLQDAMLAAATVYMGVYITLRLAAPWYLLPAYAGAFPALGFLVAQHWRQAPRWMMCGSAVAGSILVLNAVPLGLHFLTLNKYLPVHYSHTVAFLAKEIRAPQRGGRVHVFLDRVNRGSGIEIWLSLARYLQFLGLSPAEFDLRTEIDTDSPLLFTVDAASPFTVLNTAATSTPGRGDYLVITPFAPASRDDLEALRHDYEVVFRTRSQFFVPDVSAYALLTSLATFSRAFGNVPHWLSAYTSFRWTTGADYYVLVRRSEPVVAAPLQEFSQRLSGLQPLTQLRVNEGVVLHIQVTNTSRAVWPGGRLGARAPLVNLSYHWIDRHGNIVAEGQRTRLPYSLGPGMGVVLPAHIKAPAQPGHYVLRLSMVQEYVAWFVHAGGEPLALPITVEP